MPYSEFIHTILDALKLLNSNVEFQVLGEEQIKHDGRTCRAATFNSRRIVSSYFYEKYADVQGVNALYCGVDIKYAGVDVMICTVLLERIASCIQDAIPSYAECVQPSLRPNVSPVLVDYMHVRDVIVLWYASNERHDFIIHKN
jgi:hypothetical protein